jgi:ribosomal protein S18 acetylase RimI-like enzyme
LIKVLEYNNRRVGFYRLVFKENGWYLSDLQISGLLRGKGIGTRIMILLESIVKKKGYVAIKLKVFIDNPAVNLYKRMGYKVIEKQGSSYLMEKKF